LVITVFADPLGCLEGDDRHSVSEIRLVLLGTAAAVNDALRALARIARRPARKSRSKRRTA
jgi:hypothetical protein